MVEPAAVSSAAHRGYRGLGAQPEIARGRLEPLGIRVVEVEGAPDNHRQGREGDGGGALPFADGTFDLVGNRHESYLPSEVRRVLAPGGCFLTQQVAGDFNREFYALLGEPAPTPEAPHWNLGFARAQLEAAELPPVAGGEGWEVLHFADVGALAWYLLNLPWVFPGFSFRRHRERLRGLHESGKPLAVRQFLFWLEARSPRPRAARGRVASPARCGCARRSCGTG